jgi:hypothetical protein
LAAEADVSGPPDVPFIAPAAVAAMPRTHTKMQITDDRHPGDGVSVVLPSNWGVVENAPAAHQQPFAGRVMGSIGPKGGGDNAPVVTLTVTPIPFEISIDAWGRWMYDNDGFHIVDSRYFPGPEGLFFDITGTRRDKASGRELVKRTLIRNDGKRVFTMSALCPRNAWAANKDIFWIANVTFAVLQPHPDERAETWRSASTGQPGFKIAYPASWKAELAASKSPTISGFHLRLPGDDGQTLLSYLLVRSERAPARDLPALQPAAVAMLQKSGVTVVGELQPLTEVTDPRSISVPGWLGGSQGTAHMGTDDVNLTLGFVRRADLTFTFALCSPNPSKDPISALRAQRAFEIARDTLKTEPD